MSGGPREVVLEADEAAGGLEGADAVGRAAGLARGGGERRGRRDGQRQLQPVHRGQRRGREARGAGRVPQPIAVPCQRPVRHEAVHHGPGHLVRGGAVQRGSPSCGRGKLRCGPPAGPGPGTRAGRRGAPGRAPGPSPRAPSRCRAASRQPSASRRAPCRSSRAAATSAAARSTPDRSDATAAARAAARPGVSRRRDTPRGGRASSTTPPPADDPGDGRRSANRSPGAAATSPSRRRIARAEPSGRSTASRGPRMTRAPACAVPAWNRSRSRSPGTTGPPARPALTLPPPGRTGDPAPGLASPAGGQTATRTRDVATTVVVRRQDAATLQVLETCARHEQRGSAAVRRRDHRAPHLDLAHPHLAAAWDEPQHRARRDRTAAEAPGDHGTPALHGERPVDGEPGTAAHRQARGGPRRGPAAPPAPRAARRAPRPSPRSRR